MIRIKTEKFEGTFVVGLTFGSYLNKNNNRNFNLIFDLGVRSFAIIVGKK